MRRKLVFFRFLAIWFPTKMPRGLSKFQARIIILCIWISAATIVSPWMVVFVLKEKDGYSYCVESWSSPFKSKLFFVIGNLILCYALPLVLVILSNGLIWLHVAKRKVPQESASPAAIKRVHKKTRHGVIKMLTCVTLTFLVSWLPLYVIFLIAKMDVLPPTLENMIPVAQWLGASNSSCNPILYSILNKKFRDAFRSLIPCPRSIHGQSNTQTQTNTSNSISLNNSTISAAPQMVSYRQQHNRNTFRYPIVRV